MSGLVNRWLSAGGTTHVVNWDTNSPTLALGGPDWLPPTFSILANQLMMAVLGYNQMAMCDGCSRLYFRTGRKPQRGRRNYCEPCSAKGIPERQRQQDHRAKKLAKKEEEPDG